MPRKGTDSGSSSTVGDRVDARSVHIGRELEGLLPDLARATRLAIHKEKQDPKRASAANVYQRDHHRPRGGICEECGHQSTKEVVSGRCTDTAACEERAKTWR